MRVLARVERGGFADRLLDAALPALPDPRDRALLTELVYGTLRWQGRLDYVLERFARRGLRSLHPAVRAALRVAAYQLLCLTRVPPHAAVAEAVEQVKRVVPAAAGFANACLRRVALEGVSLPLPDPTSDPVGHLAVATSKPPWLVAREIEAHGVEEARRRLSAFLAPAPLTLRARDGGREPLIARLAAAGVAARPGAHAPDAVIVEGDLPAGGVAALPGFAEGAFAVQDEASQLVSLLLDPPTGARVLDACAAPGGKSGHLADLSGPSGRVTALDVDEARLALLDGTVARLRLAGRVAIARHDATRPLPAGLAGPYDAVLVDAPCSGLGVARRNPDVLWRRGPEELPALAARQRAILEGVAPAVRPGGRLLYAVCTTTSEEGPGVVEAFLRAHPEFEPEAGPGEPAGRLVTHPADGGLDAFFAQRLRRRG